MGAATLDQAIGTAMQLPLAKRDILADILGSRQIEAWRGGIAADARDSIAAFRAGELKVQSAEEVTAQLRLAPEDVG